MFSSVSRLLAEDRLAEDRLVDQLFGQHNYGLYHKLTSDLPTRPF
jgi:hypothetical protein